MKKFALIGAAGYIAPRHFKAIHDTNNELVAAYDKNDSVGQIDNYFPHASFFTEFERFDRHIDKLRRNGNQIGYTVICSPNYLHDAHIRFGLRSGSDVICEKPIVLNPWNLEALESIEKETNKKIFTILQLRLHPAILALKQKVEASPNDKIYDIDLTYITSRGNWYYTSWKGDDEKSGGIATNIGVHFFDMLGWIFGRVNENTVHIQTHDRASGYLEFNRARVRWFLSINEDTIPIQIKKNGLRTYRSMLVDGEEIEFSGGFTELHTESYKEILSGAGYGISEAKLAIQTVYDIRHKEPIGLKGDFHPFSKKELSKHPFKS